MTFRPRLTVATRVLLCSGNSAQISSVASPHPTGMATRLGEDDVAEEEVQRVAPNLFSYSAQFFVDR